VTASDDARASSRGALAWLSLLVAALAGCSDLSQRWELDHARVLAVQLSSPGLAAGATATVAVLGVDDDGAVAELTPVEVAPASDRASAAAAMTVLGTPTGWTVTAGDAAALAAARAQAGLADDAPLEVQLRVTVQLAGRALIALKTVRLGEALQNPAPPQPLFDGAATVPARLRYSTTAVLTLAEPPPADSEVSVAWLTSTGAMERSETASATLSLASGDAARGTVVVLLRDVRGGVAWAAREVVVE
jgi:hypothetical protein